MAILTRRLVTLVDEIYQEGARDLARPLRIAAAAAVIKNPYAGEFKDDISLLSDEYSKDLGPRLSKLAADALGDKIESFGKASLVGLAGEIQHGSAIIHTRLFGDAVREVANGRAPITSAEKRGGTGTPIDVSFRGAQDTGALDGTDVSHLFTWTMQLPDAPLDDEIVIIVAVANGGRPNPR